MTDFSPMGFSGPGSQPEEADGAELDILQMPSGMTTFSMPDLPEKALLEAQTDAMQVLNRLQKLLTSWSRPVEASLEIELSQLDSDDLELVNQVLGEGEVSASIAGLQEVRIQESVLAGIWRVRYYDGGGGLARDVVEVGPIPSIISRSTFAAASNRVDNCTDAVPAGVINAPPLLAEINDKISSFRPGLAPHVINLTLLPQTEQDLAFLSDRLGEGSVTILSRGYGNCRISSSATAHVWWVQYFNSQDANILTTLEIGGVPEVACAAPEDIEESALRLEEILEIYR